MFDSYSDDGVVAPKGGEMINEYVCKVCGAKFRHIDYPKVEDVLRVMDEHVLTNHGLNSALLHRQEEK